MGICRKDLIAVDYSEFNKNYTGRDIKARQKCMTIE